jgi:hypothetical protein
MNFDRDADQHGARVALDSRGCSGRALRLAGVGALAVRTRSLEIVTKSGVHVFSVEMATTKKERTTDLIYREELPTGEGCCSFIRRNGRCRCG